MGIRINQHADCRRHRSGWIAAILLALTVCSGCWEEIHYTPPTETTEHAAATDGTDANRGVEAAEEPTPAAEAAPMPAGPPTEEASPPPPSSNDLFPTAESEAEAPLGVEGTAEVQGDDTAAAADGADSILPTPSAPEEAGELVPNEGSPSPAAAEPPTPAERHQAWQAVSKWSLAAAIHAKGLPNSPQTPILREASEAASAAGVELPEPPSASRDDNLQAAVIEGLRGELAVAVTNAYTNRFGEAEAAAADLAIRSHLLLLTYSPRNADSTLEAEGLRRAGEASGLPAELWTPLVELVEQRAPFLEVRQAVFDLHRRVDALLSEAAENVSGP